MIAARQYDAPVKSGAGCACATSGPLGRRVSAAVFVARYPINVQRRGLRNATRGRHAGAVFSEA